MGFYNIMLEGQQAEEYKARKAKEAEDKEKAEDERKAKRYNITPGQQQFGMKNGEDYESALRTFNASKANFNDVNKRGDKIKSPNVSMKEKEGLIKGSPRTIDDINMHTDAIQKHMKRHPEQWDGDKYIGPKKESCGIFESVEFLNERGSFKAKKEIKNSEDYVRMKEIVKEYKKEKDEEKKDKLRDEGIRILDKLIAEAEDIPSDGFFEWIARFIIRQFDNGFRLFVNLVLGFSCFKCTKYMTRSDFLDQLYEIKADIQKKK